MVNEKNKKKLIMMFVSVAFALCAALLLFCGQISGAKAEEVSLSEEISFKEKYSVGETLEIPDASLLIGGESFPAEKIVYYPNGDVYKTNSVLFKDNGTYTLEYRASKDGKAYKKTFSFDAEKALFSVTSARSRAEYGTDLMLENYPAGTSTGIPGINVSLAEGDYFNFNQAIDLSDNDKITPFLDIMYVPSKGSRTYDAQFIYITLTDAYNPDNVVTIRLYTMTYDTSDWENVAYRRDAKARVHVAAAASGQTPKAINGTSISTANEGTSVQTYNWAMTTDTRPFTEQDIMLGRESSLQLYYEYATHCIYATGYITSTPRLIVDLDELTYQDASFGGFETGEVLLSMYGGGYFAPTLNTVLTNIDGQTLDNGYSDVSKVEIFIDTTEYGDGEPIAMKGEPFAVFPASAADVYHQDEETSVSARVYRNYYLSGAKTDVPIIDGKFTPNSNAVYTIEYTAVGYNGEKFVKTIDVKAKEFPSGDFVSSEAQSKGKSGRLIPVFDISPISAVGKISVKYTVYDAANNEIPVNNGYFKPQKSGIYNIVADVSDYAGRQMQIVKNCIVEGGGILLYEEPKLDNYYFTNKKYVLPAVTAYDYTNQTAAEVTVKVNDNPIADNEVTFTGETAIISYVSGDDVLYEKQIRLIDGIGGEWGTEYSFEKFFVLSDGLEAEATEESIKIKATENKNVAKAEFVNPLYADGLNFILSFANAEFENFEKISFYLIDCADENNALKISFVSSDVSNGKYVLYINDNRYPYQSTALKSIGGEYKLDISYSETFSTVSVEDGFERSLKMLGYGDSFDGFESAAVRLVIELENVGRNAEFNVKSICGQGMSSSKSDYVSASVVTEKEYDAYLNYGDILEIHKAYGVDVASGICNAYVTVKTPSGQKAVSEDGVKLDSADAIGYKLLIEEYGFYVIEYTVYDASGNFSQRFVSLISMDRTPPVISVTFDKATAALGENFTLPSATVSDNDNGSGKNTNVYCMVQAPNGRKYFADFGDTITFTVKGKWLIRYYGVDASGNTAKTDFTVTVQ